MALDYKTFIGYITEVEFELINIGGNKCNKFADKTQLSAVLFLLIRCSSLLRSVLATLENDWFDAYDTVRRAHLESWLLVFEFRLKESEDKSLRWHENKSDAWSPYIRRLEEYSKAKGISTPLLGKDYGGLSAVAHPTKHAAENSLVVVGARHGHEFLQKNLTEVKKTFENEDTPELMYRYLWMVLHESEDLISVGVNEKHMPTAVKYAEAYKKKSQADGPGSEG